VRHAERYCCSRSGSSATGAVVANSSEVIRSKGLVILNRESNRENFLTCSGQLAGGGQPG
jgi:hypothetical protein